MSAAERDGYLTPTRGPLREVASASSGTPAGTFGTAPRFGPPPQSGRHSAGARGLALAYGLSTKSPGRAISGGYASLAQARSNQPQAGPCSARSKTPAPIRNFVAAAAPNAIPARRAVTPPSRVPAQYGTVPDPTIRSPARRNTVAAASTSTPRQANAPGAARAGTSDRMVSARTPGRSLPVAQATTATPSPSRQDAKRPYTAPNSKATTRTPRLAYDDSPAAATRIMHTATTSTTAVSSPSVSSGRLQAHSTVPPARTGGRFQEPAEDWLASYERSSMGVLQELERILGGLVQLGSSSAPAPVEAGAPPLQLPKSIARTAEGAALGSPLHPPHVGPTGFMKLDAGARPAGSDLGLAPASVLGGANVHANPQATGASGRHHPTAWGAPNAGPGPSTGPVAAAHPQTAFSQAAGGQHAAAATAAGSTTMTHIAAASNLLVGAVARLDGQQQPSGPAMLASGGMNLPLSVSAPPAVGATQSGGIAISLPPAPLSLPPGAIGELWSVVQACSQATARLMADLAAARRETELANERAEEADSLARTFQQQLISRQRSATAWQQAIVDMEEREAAARQKLTEAQARCNAQEQRAQMAERVAATAQIRLESLMAQRGPQSQPDGAAGAQQPRASGSPDPKLQQQLEHLQADLAGAQTRATRAELELAVVRNKALIAQQELAAEEERARRAAVAAAAAREELGRTRTALEMMGLDHDRLQGQLEGLRGKIRDSMQGPSGPSRPDLLAAIGSRQPHHRTIIQSPPPPQAASFSRADGVRRLLPASQQVSGAAAESPFQAATRSPQAPTPGGAGERRQRGLSYNSGRAGRTPSDSSENDAGKDDFSGASGADGGGGRSRGAAQGAAEAHTDAAATQRPRSGSLLLVSPGELPLDTSASLRYGHRMVMRRRSRSQDVGRVGPPSPGASVDPWRPDDPDLAKGSGNFMGAVSSAAARVAARVRSPRTMSGSHDGVVRRLNMDVAEHSADNGCGAAATAVGDSGGRRGLGRSGGGASGSALSGRPGGRGVAGSSDDDDNDGGIGGGEGPAHRLGSRPVSRSGSTATASTGSVHRAPELTEEMLPLSRTPSSGVRRRSPSARTSQSSASRIAIAQQVTSPPAPPNPGASAGTGVAETAGGPPLGRAAAAPAAAAEPKRADQLPAGKTPPPQPGAGTSQSGRGQSAEVRSTGPELHRVASAAVAGTAPSASSPSARQQQLSGQEDRLSVSLADLRRQLAASTAPGSSDGAPRRRSFGLARTSAAPAVMAATVSGSAASAGSADATVTRDSRPVLSRQVSFTPSHAQEQQQPQRPQPETHQNQTTSSSPPTAHADRSTAPSRGAMAGTSLRVLPPLPELLPPLEQSNSPPERPRRGDGCAATAASRSPLAPSISFNPPQPSPCVAGGAAAAGVSTSGRAPPPGAAVRGPALTTQISASHRTQSALPTSPSRLGAQTTDTSLPQGYRTSHLNDLYESTQTRWGSTGPGTLAAAPGVGAEPPPRGLLAPSHSSAAASSVSFLPHGPQPKGLPGPPHQGAAAASPLMATPLPYGRPTGSGRVDSGPGVDAAGLLDNDKFMALTPRSRMLSPAQLDSHLVSPSVTNSMAAVASIDGSLPADPSVPSYSWRQQLEPPLQQHPTWPHQRAPSRLRSTSSPDLQAGPAPKAVGPATSPVPTAQSPAAAGRASPSVGPPQARPGSSSSAVAVVSSAGAAQQRCRRPWWSWLLPGLKPRAGLRGAGPTGSPQSPRQSASPAAEVVPAGRSHVSRSPSPLRPSSSSPMPVQSTTGYAPANAGADRPMGRGSSPVARAPDAVGGALPSGSPNRRTRGTGAGKGGKGRLLRSVLLHIGMWSGGVAVGVLLVLGLAGVVEGTLGVGGGAGALLGRDGLCGCPPVANSDPGQPPSEQDRRKRDQRSASSGNETPR